MLFKKAVLMLLGAASAISALPAGNDGYEEMDGAAGPSNQDAVKGGLQRFEFVRDHMAPGDTLARSSAPYYNGNDKDQKITPETIAALKKNGITHIISLNEQAESEEIKKALADAGIAYTPLPVRDFQAPTENDFQRAWDSFVQNRSGGTLVWCGFGHGRTGTMISALQMYAQHQRGQLQEWTSADYRRNHVERPGQEEALNALQQRLRSQPAAPAPDQQAPALSDEQFNRLMSGDFSGLTCPTVLASVLALLQKHTKRSPLGNAAMLRGRQATPAPTTGDCERARDLLQRRNIPQPCREIKNIEFGLTLSDDYSSGTYDFLAGTLEGPKGKAHFEIANAPSRGTQHWVPINTKEAFGSDTISVESLDKITLTAQGSFWTPLRNDQWKVQDLQLRAECAEPGFKANDNKFLGLNMWYGHPGGWFLAPIQEKTVATFGITPGDWSFAPPCSSIKELKYDFKVGNTNGGGTWDKLSFTIGQGKEIALGDSISAGFTKAEAINLKDTFGKDTVDIRDLKTVTIGDNLGSSILSGDLWTFQGITFSATCAEVPKKMEMKKYASVNKDVKHVENAPAWTGDIGPQDWIEVVG